MLINADLVYGSEARGREKLLQKRSYGDHEITDSAPFRVVMHLLPSTRERTVTIMPSTSTSENVGATNRSREHASRPLDHEGKGG